MAAKIESLDELLSWANYKTFMKERLKQVPTEDCPFFISKTKLDFDENGKKWSGFAVLVGVKGQIAVNKLKLKGLAFREALCSLNAKAFTVPGLDPTKAKQAELTLKHLKLGYSMAGVSSDDQSGVTNAGLERRLALLVDGVKQASKSTSDAGRAHLREAVAHVQRAQAFEDDEVAGILSATKAGEAALEAALEATVAEERALFSQFDPDIDTFQRREESLDPGQIRALDMAMANMILRAERRHAELFGANRELTADDLDELIQIFSHIPRGLVPPRFKKELQDWRRTRDAMNEMAIAELMKEQEPEVAEGIRNVIEAITSPSEYVTEIGELAGEDFERIKSVIEKAAGTLDVISNSIGALQAGGERLSSEERTDLEERMATDEVVSSLTEFADVAADLGGDFIPIIGTINTAKNVVLSGATTLSRINNAMGDGILRDIASHDAASQLARALGQSCARQKRLATESAMDTVNAAVAVAGDVTAPATAGTLKIVGTTLKLGTKVVLNINDAMTDTQAVDVLRRARAGDEAAQQEVFRRHAHYAKWLLADAAKRGDRLAHMFFADRGLTEADIEDNSTEILMKFGLRESGETAAPESSVEKMRARFEKVAAVAERVGSAITSGVRTAWRFISGSSPEEPAVVAPPAQLEKLFTLNALKEMSAQLKRGHQLKAALARNGETQPAWLAPNMEKLDDGLLSANGPLSEYLGTLTNELAAAASDQSEEGRSKAAAIQAQMEPLREALGYLAEAGKFGTSKSRFD